MLTQLLRGKRILVTGAARGLGLSFSQAIARAGADIVMCDILEDELYRVAEVLSQQYGTDVTAYRMDISSPDSIEKTFRKVAQQGIVHGLVNNAAIATQVGGKDMLEHDIEQWDRIMQVNVRGTWLVSRAAVPLLSCSDNGKIVNIVSDTALWGAPNLLGYVASKGAVIAMTRSMARELGQRNICVNAIAPGLTCSEATEYVPESRHQLYQQGRALTGKKQYPQDIDDSVIFLLSNGANFITGQLMAVNGGFVFH